MKKLITILLFALPFISQAQSHDSLQKAFNAILQVFDQQNEQIAYANKTAKSAVTTVAASKPIDYSKRIDSIVKAFSDYKLKTDAKIKELNSNAAAQTATNTNLNSAIASLNSTINILKLQITDLKATAARPVADNSQPQIDGLQSQINTLSANDTKQDGSIVSLENGIQATNGQVSLLSDTITAERQRIDDVIKNNQFRFGKYFSQSIDPITGVKMINIDPNAIELIK